MMLTDAQLEFMRRFGASSDGRVLREILEAYIIEIKDSVMSKKITVDAGNEAIGQFSNFINKLNVASGTIEERPKPSFV